MIFFTDLDGTLIRSAEKKRAGDVVIEYKGEREITCMAKESVETLSKLGCLIPVTTRSIEQYLRIRIPGFSPKFALTDNGGNLLVDGVPDKEWAAWSAEIVKARIKELERCHRVLENDPDRSFEIRMVDGVFLFSKSKEPARTVERLSMVSDRLDCYSTGAKVYAVPRELNKGTAARRLLEIIGRSKEKMICAGDSVMDIPLLEIADIAVYPDDMGLELNGFSCPREKFCEFVAEKAKEFFA